MYKVAERAMARPVFAIGLSREFRQEGCAIKKWRKHKQKIDRFCLLHTEWWGYHVRGTRTHRAERGNAFPSCWIFLFNSRNVICLINLCHFKRTCIRHCLIQKYRLNQQINDYGLSQLPEITHGNTQTDWDGKCASLFFLSALHCMLCNTVSTMAGRIELRQLIFDRFSLDF